MRKLDLSTASSTNGFPVKSGTLNYIFDAIQESDYSRVYERLQLAGYAYDSSKAYILYGVKFTNGGPTNTTEGYIFFDGEIFYVPAISVVGTVASSAFNLR